MEREIISWVIMIKKVDHICGKRGKNWWGMLQKMEKKIVCRLKKKRPKKKVHRLKLNRDDIGKEKNNYFEKCYKLYGSLGSTKKHILICEVNSCLQNQ